MIAGCSILLGAARVQTGVEPLAPPDHAVPPESAAHGRPLSLRAGRHHACVWGLPGPGCQVTLMQGHVFCDK